MIMDMRCAAVLRITVFKDMRCVAVFVTALSDYEHEIFRCIWNVSK